MKLLCISNGHGEDAIALRILAPLQKRNSSISLSALPLTGSGSAYLSAAVPIIGPTQVMPSGGFINRDLQQLTGDLKQGLLGLTRSQLTALKVWAKTGDRILAVGDIVPLLFAYLSGLPYAFVGTAKSDYWLRDEQGKLPTTQPFPANLGETLAGWSGSVYLPWERWLMARPRCRAIFVRDALTAQRLQSLGLGAHYLGNPMMDNLAPSGQLSAPLDHITRNLCPPSEPLPPAPEPASFALQSGPTKSARPDRAKATALYVTPKQHSISPLTILLIPGSRPTEAYENWANILAAAPGLIETFGHRPLILLAAIAPSLSVETLQASLIPAWQSLPASATNPYPTYTQQNLTLLLINDAYSDCLHHADLAIATAGTATEQFIGLGKPAITLPGNGPQFTPTFATIQAKMLGPSIQIVTNSTQIGSAIAKLIHDPDRLQLIYQNGKQRMGEPGAGQRIATQLLKTLTPPYPTPLNS